MDDTRHKNSNWQIREITYPGAQLAVLMDIRDELKQLNVLLHCENFQRIPHKLDRVGRNTAKPRKRRKV